MPGGQPTKYDPKYCEALIEHRSKGFSFESFAATIGTHRDTLYEWAKIHPEFSDAKRIALEACHYFHEKFIAENVKTGRDVKFNTAPYIFMLKNVLKWSDRVEHKVESDGKGISVTYKNGDLTFTPSVEVPNKPE